jgi:RNAse (barnase) inhibitor barstar
MGTLTNKDIIKKWKSGESIDWRTLTIGEKKEWLLACLFDTGLPKGSISGKDYTIDGSEINDSVDLYCLLGQIFFGDKGYFGQDLDGLDDCFVDLKVLPETTLTIKNHQRLANILNGKVDNYFVMLIDIFKEHGLKVRLV